MILIAVDSPPGRTIAWQSSKSVTVRTSKIDISRSLDLSPLRTCICSINAPYIHHEGITIEDRTCSAKTPIRIDVADITRIIGFKPKLNSIIRIVSPKVSVMIDWLINMIGTDQSCQFFSLSCLDAKREVSEYSDTAESKWVLKWHQQVMLRRLTNHQDRVIHTLIFGKCGHTTWRMKWTWFAT